ncbi:MAG: poly-gamma-glutamate biosynthesis protein PgsC [Candidatus Marinimicrobia bacterium]|jgi:poly-gamma-glutamate biosynthesis protein PgsC/CapC|nr:poly-gamma-glutamate biosynthesis protein PgsC [Candidatus Neomarinimicrobiota bacterium]MBS00736.1 poly-gamma-glutamate biosynthesis protein PgsC [Candidatus Neomarinimicrobiota bacterium]MEC7935840.1 poly-gamma-glutamate biosynthesis protein PgsC [Candidatus Neomarinimicrobiota bacterium]MEC9027308.1 poly-gamma-glutamate biosynthesis protein PgsC [Candidatus Neomarinimicrobiota bacterium]MEC9106625.1 poly-gamma-glutamate biosynthesis protein PgsC [Candidatus Neomarinimicrobiota bacterium]|tara:strand:+ start:2795 stop:3238 length:444 start_codon:yes stop_codon:yes gene_type:complete
MTEVTIGLGIALSLILSETLGVTAGGVIVPGYIAMHLHNPDQIIMTFIASIIVIILIRMLGKFVFIYGKRRLVLTLLLGFIIGYISRNYFYSPIDSFSYEVIGNIIPGLIASWMDRQGIVRTISAVIITSVLVKLTIMVLSGGIIYV